MDTEKSPVIAESFGLTQVVAPRGIRSVARTSRESEARNHAQAAARSAREVGTLDRRGARRPEA